MSAEVLREAARLMRERAKDATCVYATHHPKAGQVVPWFDAADVYSFDETDGPHIMGWSPAVALAVADWLDAVAERQKPTARWGRRSHGWTGAAQANAVARAYLGDPS